MHFDTTLNIAWLLLGLVALASTAFAAFRRPSTQASKWFNVIGVTLIVAALFPFISATDDIIRIEHFNSQHRRQHDPGKRNQNDDLVRLYETMDTPLVCRTCQITVTVAFTWIVVAQAPQQTDRVVPLVAGRSPPFFSAA